jgi:hypothetical protein
MLPSFQFSVPADARYRVLAPEVAAKYAALAGCPETDVQAVLADVDRVASDLAAGGEDIAMVFGVDAGGLLVTLTSGTRSQVVRRALPAGS